MRIDTAQRRARLVTRHLLVPGARVADPVVVADAVVALHATDPASVFLSAAARMADLDVAAVERALYQDRTLLRLLAMRRTMFVVGAGRGRGCSAGGRGETARRPVALPRRGRRVGRAVAGRRGAGRGRGAGSAGFGDRGRTGRDRPRNRTERTNLGVRRVCRSRFGYA